VHLVEKLKGYFDKREEVAFAFLFGSQANGLAIPSSDIDVAIYFYPKSRKPIEFEEPIYYEKESEIWTELEKLLEKEVEVLILNRAPATISASAIRGVPIVIRDWGLYLDFMVVVTSEAADFRDLLIRHFLEE